MDRRNFLTTLGFAAGTTVVGSKLMASDAGEKKEFMSVLVDTTLCEGCRSCEYACAEANGLPDPVEDDEVAFQSYYLE